MDQAFPLRLCILQAIKSWMVGRPGNEATVLHAHGTEKFCDFVLPNYFGSLISRLSPSPVFDCLQHVIKNWKKGGITTVSKLAA